MSGLIHLTDAGNNGLSDDDPRALACDGANRILYVGLRHYTGSVSTGSTTTQRMLPAYPDFHLG
ncbi:MAG: hypothetical protein ACJZ5P_06690 [Candidatus Thalassarchaeaceae archaeon]